MFEIADLFFGLVDEDLGGVSSLDGHADARMVLLNVA